MAVTNASLLLRLRCGADPASWSEFVRLYEPMLRSYVSRCGLQPSDADDVLQEILVRLLRSLPSFEYSRSRGRFRDWLRCVARHSVSDWRRRQGRFRSDTGRVASIPGRDVERWNDEHRRRVLQHALQVVRERVSDRVWLCFERYVLKGQNASRVADELGFGRPAVYVIASRLRKQLQRKCAQFDEDLCDGSISLPR